LRAARPALDQLTPGKCQHAERCTIVVNTVSNADRVSSRKSSC